MRIVMRRLRPAGKIASCTSKHETPKGAGNTQRCFLPPLFVATYQMKNNFSYRISQPEVLCSRFPALSACFCCLPASATCSTTCGSKACLTRSQLLAIHCKAKFTPFRRSFPLDRSAGLWRQVIADTVHVLHFTENPLRNRLEDWPRHFLNAGCHGIDGVDRPQNDRVLKRSGIVLHTHRFKIRYNSEILPYLFVRLWQTPHGESRRTPEPPPAALS